MFRKSIWYYRMRLGMWLKRNPGKVAIIATSTFIWWFWAAFLLAPLFALIAAYRRFPRTTYLLFFGVWLLMAFRIDVETSLYGEVDPFILLMFAVYVLFFVVYFHRTRWGMRSIPVLPFRIPVPRFTVRKRFSRERRQAFRFERDLMRWFVTTGLYEGVNPASIWTVKEKLSGSWQVDFHELPHGMSDDRFISAVLPPLSAALHTVRTTPLDTNPYAGNVSVLFSYTDPLVTHLDSEKAPVLVWDAETLSDPFCWLPVGVDSKGDDFCMPLMLQGSGGLRTLIAGESGSGKSSIPRQQLLFAIKGQAFDVVIFDGKGDQRNGFALFEPYVRSYVNLPRDGASAFWEQMRLIESERDERAVNGWDKPLFWFLDEFFILQAVLTNQSGKVNMRAWDEFMMRLQGIMSVARSLGIVVTISSQTFKADIISTPIRNTMVDLRVGHKLGNVQESMYLGFSSDDQVRPDLIRGKMLRSGRFSSVGQFAAQGSATADYGKSFFITDEQISYALSGVPTWAERNGIVLAPL